MASQAIFTKRHKNLFRHYHLYSGGEVESWLASSFRKPQYTIPKVKPDARLNPSDPGYIPPPVVPESINTQIRSGYIFLTLSGLTLSGAIASAALSQQVRGFFKERPQTPEYSIENRLVLFRAWCRYWLRRHCSLGRRWYLSTHQRISKKQQVDDVLAIKPYRPSLLFARGLEE